MRDNTKKALYFFCGFIAALLLISLLFFFNLAPFRGNSVAHTTPATTSSTSATKQAGKSSRVPLQLTQQQAEAIQLTLSKVNKEMLMDDLSVIATVVPDESHISHIHTRVAGWIEKLYITNTGESVRAGQAIADIYSQELYASQIDYLAARELKGPPSAIVESGRNRLKFFGMSEAEILEIEKSGKPHRLVTLFAPRPGIVAHRGIAVGTAVDPTTEIAVILDLSRVWVWAEVPEAASDRIKKGMTAHLQLGSGSAIAARVEFIDPLLTETTRALKVRFSLPNPQRNLRPGSYGKAIFKSAPRAALTVPREALVDTGDTQYVYVMKTNDLYEPRSVRVGVRQKDRVEILDGLSEGEPIVAAGVFLLDSESRLRASGGQSGGHSGHGKAPDTPAPASASRQHGSGERHD